MRIVGVILAGGEGRRMGGRDKALLPLAGRPLLAHAVERLGPQVAALALSANGDPARFAATGLPVLPDAERGQGPLAGLLAGLDWAAGMEADAVVTVAVDTPFFPCDLVPCLQLAAESAPQGTALAESAGAVHPTFGFWPVGLREDLRRHLAQGRRKLRDWPPARAAARAAFPAAAGDPFFNINGPEDLARAEALAAGA